LSGTLEKTYSDILPKRQAVGAKFLIFALTALLGVESRP
jgi:hypothetical protein